MHRYYFIFYVIFIVHDIQKRALRVEQAYNWAMETGRGMWGRKCPREIFGNSILAPKSNYFFNNFSLMIKHFTILYAQFFFLFLRKLHPFFLSTHI